MRKTLLAAFLVLSLAPAVVAQETPTEREAGRDVIKQINALSSSLGVPALVTKLTAAHAELRDAAKTEFTNIHDLFGEYQGALQKAYPKPDVSEPK